MLEHQLVKGAADACAHFGLKLAEVPGAAPNFLDKAKAFGMGQVDAAKSLFHNLRGGMGGKMNPGLITGEVPPQSMGLARATHRAEALGNMKTLAPSLLAGGALYLLHQRKKQREQQGRQQQAAIMAGGGLPAYAASGQM